MTYVYVAKSESFIKVGFSIAPLARVSTISNGQFCPEMVEPPFLIHAAVGDREDEKQLHLALEKYRIIGEWYRSECLATPALTAFLEKPASFGPEQVKLAFRCSESLKKAVRIAAAEENTTIEDLCAELLSSALAAKATESKKRRTA